MRDRVAAVAPGEEGELHRPAGDVDLVGVVPILELRRVVPDERRQGDDDLAGAGGAHRYLPRVDVEDRRLSAGRPLRPRTA